MKGRLRGLFGDGGFRAWAWRFITGAASAFSAVVEGRKAQPVIHIAQALGFKTRALRLDMDDLDKLALPCVLHWDLNHFVVLQKVSHRKAVILDPAIGKRVLPLAEVSEHFTGVALELAPGEAFAPRKALPSISVRQLTGRVTGLWRALAQILLLSIALQVFVVLSPFFMQWVVDQVLVSADRDLLTVLGLGFGLALLLQIGIGLLRGWSVVYLSSRLGLQWMRSLPRQVDSCKGEFARSHCWRKTLGGRLPSDSCGRSSL